MLSGNSSRCGPKCQEVLTFHFYFLRSAGTTPPVGSGAGISARNTLATVPSVAVHGCVEGEMGNLPTGVASPRCVDEDEADLQINILDVKTILVALHSF